MSGARIQLDLLVKRDDLHELRFDEPPPAPLQDGEARLRVDAFALTSNNITYAVFGDAMQYWKFFPAPEPGWGRIPVWGFADVTESRAGGVDEGERVYGYFPMSTELVVRAGRVDERGFVDTADHRAPMAAAYNQYSRTDRDRMYEADREAALMLLRPLLYTAFMLDDFVDDKGRFGGASTVVLTSASSKTAAGTAFFLSERDGIEVVGLTSKDNVGFVEGLGVYHRVVTYDAISSLDRTPAVFIDVAGSASAREDVHRHFAADLVASIMVGGTHWNEGTGTSTGGPLPGAPPSFFFAPDQIRKRAEEWGGERLESTFADAWRRAVNWSDGWMKVVESRGPATVEAAYREVLEGRSAPSIGHVLSLHE